MDGTKLREGEKIMWQAKPAPRCYTFRHWRHSLFGVVFLSICLVWQWLGLDMAAEYNLPWLSWLPVPFILVGLYFAVGHLLQARLEWNNVQYAITDQRVLAVRGVFSAQEDSLLLCELTYFKMQMQGQDLGTIKLYAGDTKRLVLQCIEHPRRATGLLQMAVEKNCRKE